MTNTNDIDNIYTDLIMEHSSNSPYMRNLYLPTCSLHGHNPNCGDDITLNLKIENNKIVDAAFVGHGCAISQSSTSIMIETLIGKTIDEAKEIIDIFINMIERKKLTPAQKKKLGNSVAFENISNMPARVKCALLSWRTLQNMLEEK